MQPKRQSAAIWQHCANLPAPYEHHPDQWVLRAGYKAQRSTKTAVRLMTTTNSPVLSSWPAEMRTFSSESAALAAAPRFQQYLNSSERKAAPKRAAPSPAVGATPQQQHTEQLCPASKRQCAGAVTDGEGLRKKTKVLGEMLSAFQDRHRGFGFEVTSIDVTSIDGELGTGKLNSPAPRA